MKVDSLVLLLDSQAAVYIIVPNLKNSTGWNPIPAIFTHLVAPLTFFAKPGIKTRSIISALPINMYLAIGRYLL